MKEIVLASIDESEPYEVDENIILYYPESKTFALKSGSGCSCWDGEYDYEDFNSLDAIEASLVRDERQYSPSFAGAKELIAEARKALAQL